MIALLAILATIAAVLIVPMIATSVARNVAEAVNRGPGRGSIDQDMVEARLGRIEEAIDAMALQIETLTDQQRALLGAPRDTLGHAESERSRTERPR